MQLAQQLQCGSARFALRLALVQPMRATGAYFVTSRQTRARKRLTPATPSSCQSRSRSGGAANKRVHARGVGAVAGHHVVGRNHVALRLGHLGAVFDDHALREQPPRRLVVDNQPQVAHHLGPEARVDQVQNGVLHAADVLVDGEPVLRNLPDRRARWSSSRRYSDRSTSSNRQTYPSCRSRACAGPPHLGQVVFTNSGTRPSGEPPCCVISICSGSSTGN